jgi:hypothetical protein
VLPSEDGYFRALVRPAAFLIRFTLAADTLNSAAIADADFFGSIAESVGKMAGTR